MQRTDPQSIRQIIDVIMDKSARKTEILAMRAAALWPDVVGPGVNRFTLRRYVKNGVMYVRLSSGALKQELSFQRQEIINAINRILGKEVLREIRFS